MIPTGTCLDAVANIQIILVLDNTTVRIEVNTCMEVTLYNKRSRCRRSHGCMLFVSTVVPSGKSSFFLYRR